MSSLLSKPSKPNVRWNHLVSLDLPSSLPSFLLLLRSLLASGSGRSGFLLSRGNRVARGGACSWAGSRGGGRTAGGFTGVTEKQTAKDVASGSKNEVIVLYWCYMHAAGSQLTKICLVLEINVNWENRVTFLLYITCAYYTNNSMYYTHRSLNQTLQWVRVINMTIKYILEWTKNNS